MISWETFHPLITPEVSGCPTASVEFALAHAATEFCDRTHLWREYMDPEETQVGEAEYRLVATGVVAAVTDVSLGGRLLTHLHFNDVPPERVQETGMPRGFFLVNDDTLRFWPTPDAAYSFTAQVVLKPSKTARGVEDFLYESYADTIIDGALHRLRRIPDKEWTNLQLAELNRLSFDRGVAKARVRDYRKIPLRVKPVYF
jgi:hypothetical protein